MSVMLGLIHLDLANLCVNQKKKKNLIWPNVFQAGTYRQMYRGLGSELHNFQIQKEIIILYTMEVGMREGCAPEV